MVEWIVNVVKESFWGSLGIIRMLVMIIMPLMILLQIMTDYKWLEKLSEKTKWATDFIGVSKDALIPLLIGIFAGVSYGAGAIIFAKEKYHLTRRDIFLTMCFIIPLHAVIETSLIFWMLGVNPAVVLVSRFCMAMSGTLICKWLFARRITLDKQPFA